MVCHSRLTGKCSMVSVGGGVMSSELLFSKPSDGAKDVAPRVSLHCFLFSKSQLPPHTTISRLKSAKGRED